MTKIVKLDTLSIRASTELMPNHAGGQQVDAQDDLRGARDARGEPMLFWVDRSPNVSELWACVRTATGRTGWRRHALTPKPSLRAVAFDIRQLADGSIVVAVVATSRTDFNAPYELFVSVPLSNDPEAASWNTADEARWSSRGTFPQESRVAVRLGAGTARDLPMAVVASGWGGGTYYLADGTGHELTKLAMPAHGASTLQAVTGMIRGEHGVYVLRDGGSGRVLEFRPVADLATARPIAIPASASCIEVMASEIAGDTDVYLGGAGVHLLPMSNPAHAVAIMPDVGEVHALCVSRDTSGTSVFASSGINDRLVYAERAVATTAIWSKPNHIMTVARNAAVVRGRGGHVLFARDTRGTCQMIEDPDTKLWRRTLVAFAANDATAFPSYTTRMTIKDAAKHRAIATKVELRTSSRAYVYVNGTLHLADPHTAVVVETDLAGALTVAMPLGDLSCPNLDLRLPGGHDRAVIRPSEGVEDSLSNSDKVSDAALATVANRPLAAKTSGDLRDALTAIIGGARDIEKRGTGKPGLLRAPSPPSLPLTAVRNYSVSVVGDDAILRIYDEGALLGASEASLPDWMPDWAKAAVVEVGHALTWLSERFGEVKRFVVRVVGEALEILLEIGIETVKFLVKTVEQGVRAAVWLIQQTLGIDLNRALTWLGFLFDWEEIDRLRGDIVKDVTGLISRYEPELDKVAQQIDHALSNLHTLLPKPDVSLHPKALDELTRHANEAMTQTPELDDATESPAANWAISQLLHGGALDFGIDKIAPMLGDVEEKAQVIFAMWEALGPARDVLVKDLASLVERPFDLRAAITKLTSDVMFAVLEGARDVVAKVFAILREGFHDVVTMFTTPLPVPLFRAIIGHDLSLLDMLALLVAVPTSVSNRIITQRPLYKSAPPRALLRSDAPGLDFVRDKIYMWATVVYDALNVTSLALIKAPPLAQAGHEFLRIGANVLRLSTGFPLENGTKQRPWQVAAWSAYAIVCGLDVGALFGIMYALKASKNASPAQEQQLGKNLENLSRARGFAIIVGASVAFVFEAITSGIDHEVLRDYALTDAKWKLGQNCCYFLADMCSGGMAASKKVHYVPVLGSGGTAIIALGINALRVYSNEKENHAHANF